MPPRGCWGRSTGRTPPWLPPWTQKRVALVSRAPKIVRPRRPNKHGTRQNEVRQPAQLPRGARRAAGGGARRGSEVCVRDAGARHARAARRGSHTRGPAPDARARGSVAQVAHAGRREAEFEDGHQRATRGPAPGRQDPRRVPETGARRVSDGPLSAKLALVTGASRGIGRAVADRLYAAGAHVVRLARSLTDGSTERR